MSILCAEKDRRPGKTLDKVVSNGTRPEKKTDERTRPPMAKRCAKERHSETALQGGSWNTPESNGGSLCRFSQRPNSNYVSTTQISQDTLRQAPKDSREEVLQQKQEHESTVDNA